MYTYQSLDWKELGIYVAILINSATDCMKEHREVILYYTSENGKKKYNGSRSRSKYNESSS